MDTEDHAPSAPPHHVTAQPLEQPLPDTLDAAVLQHLLVEGHVAIASDFAGAIGLSLPALSALDGAHCQVRVCCTCLLVFGPIDGSGGRFH